MKTLPKLLSFIYKKFQKMKGSEKNGGKIKRTKTRKKTTLNFKKIKKLRKHFKTKLFWKKYIF